MDFISLTYNPQNNNTSVHKAYNLFNNSASSRIKNKFLSFDLSIHSTMSDFNNLSEANRKDIMKLYKFLDNNWVNDGYASFDEEKKFKLRAYRMLRYYFYNPLDVGVKNLLINRSINETFGKKNTLFGKIDKVYEREDSALEIVDYKSGYVIKHKNNFELSPKSAVLITLVNLKLGIYPRFLSYYYLNYNRKFTKEITHRDVYKISLLVYKSVKLKQ